MRRLLPWVALAAAVLALIIVALLSGGGAHRASSAPTPPKPVAGRVIPPPATDQLSATVTPTGQVTALSTPGGLAVTRLRSGWYTVRIAVDSLKANFDLVGPNLHRTTTPRSMDLAIWGIHFVPGTYRYMNDADPGASSHEISVY